MKVKNYYFILFIIGTIVPYWQFVNFIIENGFNQSLFIKQLFVNRVSSFFAYDVMISAIVVAVFIMYHKKGVKNYWTALMATFIFGVSSGLPLFLYLKTMQEERIFEKK